MFLRIITSLILCASFTLGSFPVLNRKGDFVRASYDSYTLTLCDGETLDIRLAGGKILFGGSASDREYSIALCKAKSHNVVRNFSGGGTSFTVDVAHYMDEDTLYTVIISYEVYGVTVTCGDNIIFKTGDDVHFWKSVNYEYNLETCSELWTDEQSLKECLEPMNDVECDDPVLIAYSDRICAGASDDWEKTFRIYYYIASEMAYDQAEANDSSGGYQDGAVSVLRDGKAICEGFANAFAALCRAQGIPAVVEFGIGFGDYDEMTTRVPTAEDWADHAWAAVFLGGKWHFVDPTYDMARVYNGRNDVKTYAEETSYYLLPLEAFSNDHRIYDADTGHGIPSAGICGDDATYEITRDGTCHISGSGRIKMPSGVNCFRKIVFEPGSNITTISKDCFSDCDLITNVIIPDTVKRIEDGAFDTCEDLEYVYLPEGLEYIGDEAFDYCDELSYVWIPDSVTHIGKWAFDDCPRLFISIPSHLDGFNDDYDMKPMFIERH